MPGIAKSIRKNLRRAPVVLVFLSAASMLAYGQQPPEKKSPRVSLGIPLPLPTPVDLWPGDKTKPQTAGSEPLRLRDLPSPFRAVSDGEQANAALPTKLRELPPPGSQATVDGRASDADDLLVETDADDDLLLPSAPASPNRPAITAMSDAALGALPLEVLQPPTSPRVAPPASGDASRVDENAQRARSLDPLPLSIYDGVGGGTRQAAPPTSQSISPQADTTAKLPQFLVEQECEPVTGNGTQRIPFQPQDFCPSVPWTESWLDPLGAEQVYNGKFAVPTQRPIIEWGKPFYTGGIYPPGKNWFGSTNLVRPHFLVYGDFRTGMGVNRNAAGDANSLATRLNLDMDLAITATERIHAFMGPLDRAGDFTRLDFSDSAEFVDRTDLRLDTLFFEGDLGSIMGGLNGTDSAFDLPFTFGFLPLVYQNGIWANDNIIGAAVALPSRHSRALNWANYDATFFWASDQVTTDAFKGDNNAAEFFGSAWFIDAYDGYIEADYAFVHDDVGGHRSYHNMAVAFTRRYFERLSNSVRLISNFGQSLPDDQKTADGHLLLLENSLISSYPTTVVPYFNLFYGQGRPQSLARAGVAGGVLNNVGINFETDGLTAYPTLEATGNNSFGGALGVNLLGTNFSDQLILEAALLSTTGSSQFRDAPGDQYALGLRYQKPLSNAWLFRTDHMYGWRDHADDIRGSRFEFRWKF